QRVLGAVFGDIVPGSSDVRVQDSFGFSTIIVVATDDDRLIALDSGSAGQILWKVPLAPAKQRQLESTLDGYVVVRNV
ncbi:hypothetical protein, partial [Klebsiella pneumoniae]|uniref:hypothetical protein n=1 Tax=Klebsiella pneumoniae TaxID=573 RepID=UPI00272FB16A